MSYTLSAVGGEAFYDTDNIGIPVSPGCIAYQDAFCCRNSV